MLGHKTHAQVALSSIAICGFYDNNCNETATSTPTPNHSYRNLKGELSVLKPVVDCHLNHRWHL